MRTHQIRNPFYLSGLKKDRYFGEGQASKTVYNYIPWTVPAQPYAGNAIAPAVPLESEIDYYDWGQSSMTKKVVKTWYDQNDMASVTTTIVPTGQVSKTNYTYTSLGSSPSSSTFVYLSEQDDYDYSLSSGTLVKKTIYSYRNPAAMPTAFPTYSLFTESTDQYPMLFPPLVSSVTVENGSSTILAQTNYSYDGAALTTVSPTGHDSNYNSATYDGTTIPRGNVTSVTRCNPVPTAWSALSQLPGERKSLTDDRGASDLRI